MLSTLSTICEIIMVICFGASWPFNIIKAYKARSTKGTSLLFMSLIGIGYLGGIGCKIFTLIEKGSLTPLSYVAFAFYFINLAMVTAGVIIYFRNKKIENAAASETNNAE